MVGVRIKGGGEVVHRERLGQLGVHQSQAGHLIIMGQRGDTGPEIYLHQGVSVLCVTLLVGETACTQLVEYRQG